jgi:hypothetical protein
VNKIRPIWLVLIALGLLTAVASAQSFVERVTSSNARMTQFQPSWVTPIATSDPRLVQYARFSASHEYTSARTETTNYGNGKGVGLVGGNRFEFDYMPPGYCQHNSSAIDGFGDMGTLVKYRIASGNATHGNYIVSAILSHTFATGSVKNGAVTDSFGPTMAGGYAFRRFDVVSTLGGTMPTGKIATQGRTVAWNSLVQAHVSRTVWVEMENNSSFYFSGSHDGKMQNFVTPGVYYVVRKKEWKPTHPFMIFDTGMQVATSGYHSYNHNLISEVRLLF